MPTPYKPIPYRRNPRPRPERGPKTVDDQSGFYTYEDYVVEDDFGARVDARDSTFDRDKGPGAGGTGAPGADPSTGGN